MIQGCMVSDLKMWCFMHTGIKLSHFEIIKRLTEHLFVEMPKKTNLTHTVYYAFLQDILGPQCDISATVTAE